MYFKILERSVGLNTRNDIDKNVKNKWVWNWLLKKDANEDVVVGKV